MADAGAGRGAEKKDTGSRTEKDMLIGMMTGFKQNIEIFLPVSGGAFPRPGSKKGVHKRSVLLIKTVLHIFSMKTAKNMQNCEESFVLYRYSRFTVYGSKA